MHRRTSFPTSLHHQVAEFTHDFFASYSQVDTVLVVNSCARGQAIPESDVDMAILVKPMTSAAEISALEKSWADWVASHSIVAEFKSSSQFAQLHVDVITGQFTPSIWDDGGGPDYFEIKIGNRIAYSAPMGELGEFFQQLQTRWLPYYDETLAQARLQMASAACDYDLEHVPFFVRRGLHFQAFDRLYKAYQEFLQALFISRRTYPIAYNKWIREQVEQWLGLPDVYAQLPEILSIHHFLSDEIIAKANLLASISLKFLTVIQNCIPVADTN